MTNILSGKTIDLILLSALGITLLSVWGLYQDNIYPASLYADCISTLLLVGALLARNKLSIDTRLGILIFAGTMSGLAAAFYNPLSAETMLVLIISVALSLINWNGTRALVAPLVILSAFSLMTLSAVTGVWHFQSNHAVQPHSVRLWLVSLLCLWLIVAVLWLTISELKKRLYGHIDQLQQMNNKLFQSAFMDAATGLPNRQYFQQQVESAMASRASFRVFSLKVNGMSLVKALHGQPKYEEGLRLIAAQIHKYSDGNSFLARVDADQFALLADKLNEADYLPALNQFQQAMRQNPQLKLLGCSHAMATTVWPDDCHDFIGLMKNLELTLHDSEKDNGELRFFSADQVQHLNEYSQLRAIVHQALDEKLFYPVYQSKIRCDDRVVAGFEGLARLRHKENFVSPAQFIPLLHEEGGMESFGQRMLEAIIQDIPTLITHYGTSIKVSANVSPPLFLSVDFVPFVKSCLTRYHVPPMNLVIEITEDVFATDINRIIQSCRELQQLGVHVSLDDFGTGFSSLSYLQLIEFDEIKIDRSFVQHILSSVKGQVLLQSMCALVKNLDCKVVIEGIEEIAQFEMVRPLADEIQGFYFSKPTPLQQLFSA